MEGSVTEGVKADTLVERPSLRSLVDDLEERRAKAKLGGGEDKIARQHEQDKPVSYTHLTLPTNREV